MTPEIQRSKDHESDAMTFLGVTQQAGAAVAKAAGEGTDSYAEAWAMFESARSQAQLHATLSVAAATRAMAAGVADLRAELEALLRRV